MLNYIFDIGGVLVNYDVPVLAQTLSLTAGCDPEALKKLFELKMLYPVETGQITGEQFFERDVSRVMANFTYRQWVEAFTEHYTLNPAGYGLLRFLKKSGRRVYILSNLADYHKEAIERKMPELFGICDRNFFSYEMGMHKPEERIFHRLCEQVGKAPGNFVFFDDLSANVEGAEKTGMTGIKFSNEGMAGILEKIARLDPGLDPEPLRGI